MNTTHNTNGSNHHPPATHVSGGGSGTTAASSAAGSTSSTNLLASRGAVGMRGGSSVAIPTAASSSSSSAAAAASSAYGSGASPSPSARVVKFPSSLRSGRGGGGAPARRGILVTAFYTGAALFAVLIIVWIVGYRASMVASRGDRGGDGASAASSSSSSSRRLSRAIHGEIAGGAQHNDGGDQQQPHQQQRRGAAVVAGVDGMCRADNSAFFKDSSFLEDHRGGDKLTHIIGLKEAEGGDDGDGGGDSGTAQQATTRDAKATASSTKKKRKAKAPPQIVDANSYDGDEGSHPHRRRQTAKGLYSGLLDPHLKPHRFASPIRQTRLSIHAADDAWEGREVRKDKVKLGNEPPLSFALAFGPEALVRRRRERFLTPEVSPSDNGGDAFFESVEAGKISITGEGRTSAVAWGDSAPRPTHRDQQGLNPLEWPRRPVQTVVGNYSEEELLAKHHAMDVVISYVNGSDSIHRFHKLVRDFILPGLKARRGGGWYPTQQEGGKSWPLKDLSTLERYLGVKEGASSLTGSMDREHDELRYNFRSLHANLRWHCGRLIILSDANIPSWLNRARNFFLTSYPQYPGGSSHPAYGKRCLNADTRRVIVVHQDAVVPMGARSTFNTNTIEMYIYRIRRLSNLYVHYNDDYLTRKPTSVSTFVNRKGGPILRFEEATVSRQRYGADNFKNGWLGGVLHTNGFIEEALGDNMLDEDYYEPDTRRRVMAQGGDVERGMASDRRLMRTTSGAGEPDHIFAYSDLRNSPYWPRPRYYLKHAPFVMCKNMFKRHIIPYYANRLTRAGVDSKHRSFKDYIPPQLHHAFATDVPWAGSSKFTPDHMAPGMRRAMDGALLHQWEREKLLCGGSVDGDAPTVIHLDNNDGCAPAQLLIGSYAHSHVITFSDDLAKNARGLQHIIDSDPTFLTLNDNGYTHQAVEDEVVGLLSYTFPHACAAEDPRRAVVGVRYSLGLDRKVKLIGANGGAAATTTNGPAATEDDGLLAPPPQQEEYLLGGEMGHMVAEDKPPAAGMGLQFQGIQFQKLKMPQQQQQQQQQQEGARGGVEVPTAPSAPVVEGAGGPTLAPTTSTSPSSAPSRHAEAEGGGEGVDEAAAALKLRRLAIELEAQNRQEQLQQDEERARQEEADNAGHGHHEGRGNAEQHGIDADDAAADALKAREADGDVEDDENSHANAEEGLPSSRRRVQQQRGGAKANGGGRRGAGAAAAGRNPNGRKGGLPRAPQKPAVAGAVGGGGSNGKEPYVFRRWSVDDDPLFANVSAEEREDLFRIDAVVLPPPSSTTAASGTSQPASSSSSTSNATAADGAPAPLYTITPAMQLYYERRYRQFNQLPLIFVIESSLPRAMQCASLRSLQLALPDFEGNVGMLLDGPRGHAADQTTYPERCFILCRQHSDNVRSIKPTDRLGDTLRRMRVAATNGDDAYGEEGSAGGKDGGDYYPRHSPFLSSIDGIMIRVPCLTVLGQTLALEDFSVRRVGDARLLYLEAPCPLREEEMTEEDLDPTAVNWVLAPAVWALMQSYPIPYRKFEPSEELLYTY